MHGSYLVHENCLRMILPGALSWNGELARFSILY